MRSSSQSWLISLASQQKYKHPLNVIVIIKLLLVHAWQHYLFHNLNGKAVGQSCVFFRSGWITAKNSKLCQVCFFTKVRWEHRKMKPTIRPWCISLFLECPLWILINSCAALKGNWRVVYFLCRKYWRERTAMAKKQEQRQELMMRWSWSQKRHLCCHKMLTVTLSFKLFLSSRLDPNPGVFKVKQSHS